MVKLHFMHKLTSTCNIFRNKLGLKYLEQHNEKKNSLIFQDVEKALDNLNWTFLFKILEDMDFDEDFIK